MIEVLLQIRAPGFCAGLVARDGRVIETAPILRRHFPRGTSGRQVADYCRQKGWSWEKVHEVRSGTETSNEC